MKKIVLLFAFAMLLISCGTSKITKIGLQQREYTGLKEGVLQKDLGDPLIISGTEKFAKGIKLNQNVNVVVKKIMGFVWSTEMNQGEVLYLGGSDKDNEYYLSKITKSVGEHSYKQGIGINKQTKETFVVCLQNTTIIDKKVEIEYVQNQYSEKLCDNCFKKELIYNGKSGNTIKIIYREFVNNMARSSFTQNLNYDLSESNIISFKGCKIEIIKAENTGIKYKILSSFNN